MYWTNTANTDYWVWKRDASANFSLDHFNGTTTDNVLTFSSSNNATFAGNVSVIGSAKFIEVGSANTGTNFGFIGWNAASKYLFIGNSYNSAYNEDIKIDSSGNSTFSGDIMPNGENLYDIGSASVRWEDIWADQVYGRDVYVDDYIYHNGDTNTYIRAQADKWTFRTGGDDRMHIDNTGVGIGTTSPSTIGKRKTTRP